MDCESLTNFVLAWVIHSDLKQVIAVQLHSELVLFMQQKWL